MPADPRYPIGPFVRPAALDADALDDTITEVRRLPELLEGAVHGLDREQLDTPYREGGWTVRQVVHHVADSHLHAYLRTKLALTEDEPLVRPYDESAWAELPEARDGEIAASLDLVRALHRRWALALLTVGAGVADPWARTLRHPAHGVLRLDQLLAMYAWHGRHHAAHVTQLRARRGW